MFERRFHFAGVVGYAVLATVAVWAAEPKGVAGVLIAPLLLVCPGYALVRAIEGGRRVDALELATTTLALSFATAALGGILLNAFHVPLTARTWSTLMLLVTAGAAAVAFGRGAWTGERTLRRSTRVGAKPLLAALAICMLLVAAAGIADHSERTRDRRTSVLTLGVAPSPNGSTLRISVVNSESAPGRYRVRIKSGSRSTNFALALRPGESWSGTRRLPRAASGPTQVQLFRETPPDTAIRTVMVR